MSVSPQIRERSAAVQAFKNALVTEWSGAHAVLRIGLAVVMFPHGAQKLLGWFGGGGPQATIGFMETMGIPPWLAWIAILTEFFGPLLLLAGFFSRGAALLIGIEMVVAVLMVHAPNGFFMNWAGQQAGEGVEYFLLLFAIVIAVLLRGSGAFSVDWALTRDVPLQERFPRWRRERRHAEAT